MSLPFGMRAALFAAWLATWLAGCSGRLAQPTLLLQLSLLTRGHVMQDVDQHRRELVLSASLALPLDPALAENARAPPLTAAGWDLPPSTPPEDHETPALAPDCEPRTDPLCAWEQRAEQLAWAQAIEQAAPMLE
jgi:hypothetical protein